MIYVGLALLMCLILIYFDIWPPGAGAESLANWGSTRCGAG